MVLLIQLVDFLFMLATLAIFARVLLSWFPHDPYNPNPAIALIYRITDPILDPIHRFIPPIGMIDISPIVALLILQVLQAIIDTALSSLI